MTSPVSGAPAGALEWPAGCYGTVLDRAPHYRYLQYNPGVRLLRHVLSRRLRPGLQVLDVACGHGIGACHLAAAGARSVTYTGIDLDAPACRVAEAVLAGLPPDRVRGRILECSVQGYLDTAPRPFDLVLWNCAFHECVDPEDPQSAGALARRVGARLAPGGCLVLGDPFIAPGATAAERAAIHAYGERIVGLAEGGNPFVPPGQIASLFTDAGLAAVERHESALYALRPHRHLELARYVVQVFVRP